MAILTVASAAQPGSTSESRKPNPESHARVRAVSEFTAAAPGQTTVLGITFEIDPGWHTYWRGASDTGQPIAVEFTLPEGWKADPIQWPAPKRLIQPGKILDYVYEKRVTLLVPILVPAAAKPEEKASISASVTWLVCKAVCLPGKATVSWSIPITSPGSTPARSADATLFDVARKTIPGPLPNEKSPVKWRWQGDILVVTASGAPGLTFYPDEKCAPLADPIQQADAPAESLSLDITPDKGSAGPVSGVLEIKQAAGKPSQFYSIAIPARAGRKDPPEKSPNR